MEAEAVKTDIQTEKKQRARARLSGGAGENGGNDGFGGGGRDDLDQNGLQSIEQAPANKLRILMWFLLAVVVMTFGGLIGAYVTLASNNVLEWRPFELPRPVLISTALILASSLTYVLSKRALLKENQERSKKWLLVTTVLGAAFISSQLLGWLALVRDGVYVQSNPYAGFFYIFTAVHALHVIGGIAALGYIVLRTWYKTTYQEELRFRQNLAGIVGLYWHTMDGLWIVLFLLLGFWK